MSITWNNNFYNGTKLLNTKDLNKQMPELFICVGNRTGGKTTFFNSKLVEDFLNDGKKFILLYRYVNELVDVVDKFFKDIKGLFFNDVEMSSESKASGSYLELFMDERPCGYAICLNNSDKIKKQSHLFSDASIILFDEFQSETDKYLKNEVKKFISLHVSLARGQGEQIKYLPVIMVSNHVSKINPYFVELEVENRLQFNTKFLRGDGWVLELNENQSAIEEAKKSGFNRAFKNNDYFGYAYQSKYLNDNIAFIENLKGDGKHLFNIVYKGSTYALIEFQEKGLIFVTDKFKTTPRRTFVLETEEHDINLVMLKRNEWLFKQLKLFYEKGVFRFRNQKCKDATIKMLTL